MPSGFTVRIHVPAGEADGLLVIERTNWTGRGLVIPRNRLSDAVQRAEMGQVGVYLLCGRRDDDEDGRTTVFAGQTDDLRGRLAAHDRDLEFWDTAVCFVSMADFLGRAHLLWIEHELMKRVRRLGRARLLNPAIAPEPNLSEFDRADAKSFFDDIVRLAPFAGVRALEEPTPIVAPRARVGEALEARGELPDTLVVPAAPDRFKKMFQGEQRWASVRIPPGQLERLRFIAAFQTAPVSAITHWAPIDRVEPYGDGTRCQVFLADAAQAIGPVQLGKLSATAAVPGPRFVKMAELRKAKSLTDLFGEPESGSVAAE